MRSCVIEGGVSRAQAALQFAVTARVVKRWVERYKAEGRAGMGDRSPFPAGFHDRPHLLYFDITTLLGKERRNFLAHLFDSQAIHRLVGAGDTLIDLFQRQRHDVFLSLF
ncbi:Helix-turn-helix domain-containing protein [Sinorhizobium meliloti]|nr:Helix-turn-helix domain-containing protein [Sinorhizobium meliloti]